MRHFFYSRYHAFQYAFSGWWYVLRTQRNAWIHALASILVLLLAAWITLPIRDWAILILTIAIVWVAEFFNSSLEAIIDLTSPGIHPLAKVGKDVAAAAVLISALASILVGLLVMGPPLWNKLQIIFNHP